MVRVVLNQQEYTTPLLDTGASHTLMTPRVAQRLEAEVMAPPDAP